MSDWERVPVPLPPVWCHENDDGTLSWPNGNGTYSRVRTLDDIPPAYIHPPTVWKHKEKR